MPTPEQYAPGDIVERGEQLYQQSIRALVEKENVGKYLAVNVETGEWVMGEDHLDTLRRARALYPNAGLYGLKVGYPATAAIGTSLRPLSETERANGQ